MAMFARSTRKLFAAGATVTPNLAGTSPVTGEQIPNCLARFGWQWNIHFMNHPAVMALSTLLELKQVVKMRANFTQENVDALWEFDEELARKAQIALDNNIAINFLDLESIENHLPRLIKERDQLEGARKEILERKPGDYTAIKSDISAYRGTIYRMKMPMGYQALVIDNKCLSA